MFYIFNLNIAYHVFMLYNSCIVVFMLNSTSNIAIIILYLHLYIYIYKYL